MDEERHWVNGVRVYLPAGPQAKTAAELAREADIRQTRAQRKALKAQYYATLSLKYKGLDADAVQQAAAARVCICLQVLGPGWVAYAHVGRKGTMQAFLGCGELETLRVEPSVPRSNSAEGILRVSNLIRPRPGRECASLPSRYCAHKLRLRGMVHACRVAGTGWQEGDLQRTAAQFTRSKPDQQP